MYLKRMEIKGFKSFAERTEIEFGPGINIIVGPNGCGKSNIVDAIRWALGESNIRHLRGQRNEDVIFSGTDKRRPLSLAQVDVVIDNRDRALPLDFSEVSVVRKVYRSGESEFYINKAPARLKDIQELFSGTGLGKRGYSIIGQGELEQILNLKPFERRLLLEEASGLIKYRHRIEEAEVKLAAIKADMARVEETLTDLEDRLEVLGEKAAKSRRHRELCQELEKLEKELMSSAIERLYRELQGYLAGLADLGRELAQRKAMIAETEQEVQLIQSRMREIRDSLSVHGEEKHRLQSELQRCEAEMRLSAERFANARGRYDDLAEEEANYKGLLEKLEENIRLGRKKLAKEENELKSKAERLRQVEVRNHELERLLAGYKNDYEDLRTELIERLKEETAHKNRLTSLLERLRKLEDRMERRGEDLQQKRARLQEVERDEARARHKLEASRKQLDALQERKKATELALDEARLTARNTEQAIAQLEIERRRIEHELKAYHEEQKEQKGYPEAIRAVMRWAEQHEVKGILGVVASFLEAPQGLETAVETALGRSVQDIVVRSEKDARRAIEFLKRNRLGRVTFLPLDLLRVSSIPQNEAQKAERLPGVIGWADRLVDYPDGLEKVVKHLLGRVLFVETLESGVKVYRELALPVKLVTLEGEILTYAGAITGGTGSHRSAQYFKRKNWAKEQARILADREQKCSHLSGELDEIKRELHQLEERLGQIKTEEEELRLQNKMLLLEVENAASERERLTKDIEALEHEEEGYKSEILPLRELIEEAKRHHEAAVEEAQRLTDRVQEIKQEHEEFLRENEVLKERTKSYREFISGKEEEIENLKQNLFQLEKIKASYLQALEKCGQEREVLVAEMDRQSKLQACLKQQCLDYQEKVTGLAEQMDHLKADLARAEEDSRILEKKLYEQKQALLQVEQQCRSAELRIARKEAEIENQLQLWKEAFGEEFVPGSGFPMDSDAERKASQRKEALARELADLGPVDQAAEAEFEELRKRHDFLSSQYRDIKEAKDALYSLLKETRAGLASQFVEFLKGINRSFDRTFSAMFSGGNGSLNPDASPEDLGCGIEIAVKMPGKRTQSLELLSGGERALTCIAFVFALLVQRPSPFCLLDEIDAALDDVNLSRFRGFLQTLSRDIQFIVITHRQGTIEIGQALYGITMPEDGVSRVLSVTIEEAEALAG